MAEHGHRTGTSNSAGDILIQACDIRKHYSHNGIVLEILKGVNLELRAGETLAITGASGIGKSTLLHILGTLDRPEQGTLRIGGKEVLALDDAKLARFRNRSIGFVFQFHHLLAEFSTIENTMMPLLIDGCTKQDALERAEAILTKVGLRERLTHPVNKLSGGEQQRVALARALVQNPLVLLADEPTGNLDIRNSEQVHALLMALNAEYRMSMIVVTHNPDLSALMSRRATIVDGQLQED